MTQKLTESDCEIMFQTVKYPIDMGKIYDAVEQILADHLKPVSEPLSRHEFDMAITSSMQPWETISNDILYGAYEKLKDKLVSVPTCDHEPLDVDKVVVVLGENYGLPIGEVAHAICDRFRAPEFFRWE
jgi:hypothetical protein